MARPSWAATVATVSSDELVEAIASCTACVLHTCRTRPVPGSGPSSARLAVVGEAPGAHEDASGLPFQGASGRLLDQALADAGIARAEVLVLNAVKCRPPANRAPTRDEIATCRPFLDAQLADVDVVVALGASAARALGLDGPLGRLVGVPVQVRDRVVLPTYHPAYALRRRRSITPVLVSHLRTAKDLAGQRLAPDGT
jgi:uracil-DNA glycosylase